MEKWSMPKWMEKHCESGLLVYPKEQIEDHMNRGDSVNIHNNAILSLMIVGTKSRVDVLEKLHNQNLL